MNSITFAASWLEPLITAFTNFSIPWAYRWRLLPFQAMVLPMYIYEYLSAPSHRVVYVPTRGKHTLRALVYLPSDQEGPTSDSHLRPLHIDFHGGIFLGGIAEFDGQFCEKLSNRTGAVVVSPQYRHAPEHAYPAAHEDAVDVVAWVLANAEHLWQADSNNLTVSGFSVGANLMMVAGEKAKAAVGFYAPISVDLRIPPWEKPKPVGLPKDPFEWMEPLYDAYGGSCKQNRQHDAQLSPILRGVESLPHNILLVVPALDILQHEQLAFIERLKRGVDINNNGPERRFEALVFDQGFHGWLELPSAIIDNTSDRDKAFAAAISFITDAHHQY